MLHLTAADIVKHYQSDVTVKSVTLAAVLFELSCIRDRSNLLNLRTVLLLTILTVSVDSDVLDVISFFYCE